MVKGMLVFFTMLIVAGATLCASEPSHAQACPPADEVRNTIKDATPALSACIRAADSGALRLKAGTYLLLTPLLIDRSLTIETDTAGSNRVCSK